MLASLKEGSSGSTSGPTPCVLEAVYTAQEANFLQGLVRSSN